MAFDLLLGIPAGVLYANTMEWLIHKYVLHDLGNLPKSCNIVHDLGKKDKNSVWRFHWSVHHRRSRKYDMADLSYFRPFWKDSARFREVMGLTLLAALHTPLFFVAPLFTITIWAYTFLYYFAHKKSHTSPLWAKKWLRHHYDHHMGKDQDKNWGVLLPIVDWIFGTREEMIDK